MNQSLLSKPVVLLGSDGKLGSSLMERFSPHGLTGIDYSNPQIAKAQIAKALEDSPGIAFVIAVAADYQVAVHETLFKAIRQASGRSENRTYLVNLNSVQDEVPQTLEHRESDIPKNTTLVGLHPHHGHNLTNNRTVDKNWLITYAKRQDRDQLKEQQVTRVFRAKLERMFSVAGITDFSLIDFDAAASDLPEFRNGAELHDKLTAYSQALVHMLRLLVDDDALFFEHFVALGVDLKLSQAIVSQNPYAKEGVYRKLKALAPDKNDPQFILKLKQLALEFINKYETRFDTVPNHILEIARTPKFIELRKKLSP